MYYSGCTTKNDVINNIARDKKLIKEIQGICKTNKIDDLLQELYLILLTKKDELITNLNERGEVKFYIIRVIMSQYFSTSSKYYELFKKQNGYIADFNEEFSEEKQENVISKMSMEDYYKTEEDNEKAKNEREKLLFIQQQLEKENWYDREIFERYMGEKTSFTKLSKKLNISRNSLWNTVDKVKKTIKKNGNIDL